METKQLARKWFEEVWIKRNSSMIGEMVDDSLRGLTEVGELKGPEGFRTLIFEPLTAAFPDLKLTIDGIIAENDDAVVRWSVSATHQGPLGQLAASGRRVKFSGMTWLKFKSGRIVAGTDSYNFHGLLAFLADGTECGTVRRG